MQVRNAVVLLVATLWLIVTCAPARCDIKLITLTRLDGSHLLIGGSRLSAVQYSELLSSPKFNPAGSSTTIWVKDGTYRIDEPGLTTITDPRAKTTTVVDTINKIYYVIPCANAASDGQQIIPNLKVTSNGKPLNLFGYNASCVQALANWQGCTLNCSAEFTSELTSLPADLPAVLPAVNVVFHRVNGLPLRATGSVNMPSFIGVLGFDWQVTAISTATFDRSELAPPPGYKQIDPPKTSLNVRTAIHVPVQVYTADASN